MPSIPYNDRAARAAQPIDGQRTRYTVTGKPGLQLVVSPGDPEPSRRWYVRYQVGHGRDGRRRGNDPIGDLKHWSVGQAWEEASKVIRLAEAGTDPKMQRQAAKALATSEARTVTAIYREWLDDPARAKTLRPRSRGNYEQQFNTHVEPHLGALPVTELTKEKIKAAVEKVRVATTDPKKGWRGYQSVKALKLIRSLCKYALAHGYITTDPTLGMPLPVAEANPNGKQHRALTVDELKAVWNGASEHMGAGNARALKLALLLGKRVSELVGALRTEVNLDEHRPVWLIPGSREGNKSREDQIVPLPSLAVAILREQIASVGESPYVFQARSLIPKAMSRHSPSQDFAHLRNTLGIAENVRFHDARALITTQLAAMGVPSEYRSHVMHHTSDMRATVADGEYNAYDFEVEKRRALELWSTRLLEIVEGRKPTGLRWERWSGDPAWPP